MKYSGILTNKNQRDGKHYCMFCKGIYYDFTENLNCQLTDILSFNIETDKMNKFHHVGIIKRLKDQCGNYAHFIDKINLDRIFEHFLGEKVLIDMKNMGETNT